MEQSKTQQTSLFEKIWLGILPLSLLYWGFAVVGGFIWKLLFIFIDENNAFAVNSFLFAALAYQLFLNVGIWRAADNYKKSIFLAWLAKIAATIGTIILLITFLGFSKLKNIQNEVAIGTQGNVNQSTNSESSKKSTSELGMIWTPISDQYIDVWYASNRIEKTKFNILTLWLKREIRDRAKLNPNNYMYTVMSLNIDCNSYTFRIDYAADLLNIISKEQPNYLNIPSNHLYKPLSDYNYLNSHPLVLDFIYQHCRQ